MNSQHNSPESTWWGQFQLSHEQTYHWKVGALKLAIQCLPGEWQIFHETESIHSDSGHWELTQLSPAEIEALAYTNAERHATGEAEQLLKITPLLADRPIITRPLTPFFVPAGENASVYISSPLWIRIEVGEPPIKLQEVPIVRMSDTWFGPNTIEGELCYATRTFARMRLENVDIRPHRAITQVNIQNKATSQLLVERLSLSVPHLSLYERADGGLWTQSVTMIRARDTGMATFQVESTLPVKAQGARLVSDPRQTPSHNMAVRAFGALFK